MYVGDRLAFLILMAVLPVLKFTYEIELDAPLFGIFWFIYLTETLGMYFQ
jgi:hypothetical protein